MEFVTTKDALTQATQWVGRVLPGRPTYPVLGAVRITAYENGRVSYSGYDLETAAELRGDAEVFTPGIALVSGRLLQTVAKVLPSRGDVRVKVDGGVVNVTSGAAEFTLPTLVGETAPELPELPALVGEVDAGEFAAALASVAFAVALPAAGVPALEAVSVVANATDGLTLAATDRYRVAVRRTTWQPTLAEGESVVASVPPVAFGDVAKFGDTVGLNSESGDSNRFGLSNGTRSIVTAALAAEFPAYERLFPTLVNTVVHIDAAELVDALQRTTALEDSAFPQVRLAFDGDTVVLTASGKDGIGSIRDELACEVVGEPITLKVNTRYLIDGVHACHEGKVSIGLQSPVKPVVVVPHDADWGPGPVAEFRSAKSGDYRYLLMPIRDER